MKINIRRIVNLWVLSVMVMPIAFIFIPTAKSAQMLNRSLVLSSALPSQASDYLFTFDMPSTSLLGSIVFEFCTNSPLQGDPCTAPVGFDDSSSIISSQTNNTGFSIDLVNSTANKIVLTRPAVAGNVGQSTYKFDSIINPSTENQTTYVKISSYASLDGTGIYNDEGTVAFSTGITSFGVGLFVPPYLTFCVGAIVAKNCSSTSSTLASFGEFSRNNVSTATTQMSAATNDPAGYNIFLNGFTLTSGNKTINAMETLTSSQVGTSQFGMNLRSNSSPSIGAEPDGGVGIGSPATGYNTVNQFKFVSGDKVASASGSSDYTLYTVSYIANINAQQPPGLYATTLTYTAVATF